MKLRVSLVMMPLLSAFSNSGGTMVARSALVLQMEHEGLEAFSECVADEKPSSTGEDNGTALRMLEGELGRALRDSLGGGPPTPRRFLEAVAPVAGNPMAKAAVEMLLWDYHAKKARLPLDEALGDSRGYAEAGIALGLGPEEELRARIGDALARGYRRVKVKIDRSAALEVLRGVREAFPTIPLSADANGCFELPADIPILKGIDAFHLQYLEQPLGFDDIRGHAKLAKEISTPICLDESLTTFERTEEALESGAAKVINVKPGRVGGLAVAMQIARRARATGAHVWVGGMLETGVGRASNVALAAQREVDLPGDTSPNDRYFESDLVKNPFVMEEGARVKTNRGSGIGVELDEGYFAKVTLKSWRIV